MSKSIRTIRVAAMDYLSRREHATYELFKKLLAKDVYEAEDISDALARLSEQGLLSDERFTEAYVHQRISLGSGPLKIRAELQQKGVNDSIIEAYLDERDTVWREKARAIRVRKYGKQVASNLKEKTRQNRFLQSRGFTGEHIRYAMWDDGV